VLELPKDYSIEVGYINLPAATGETGLEIWQDLDDTLTRDAVRCAGDAVKAIQAADFAEWGRPSVFDRDWLDPLTGGDPTSTLDWAAFATWLEGQRP
jgi:hypothetical protein